MPLQQFPSQENEGTSILGLLVFQKTQKSRLLCVILIFRCWKRVQYLKTTPHICGPSLAYNHQLVSSRVGVLRCQDSPTSGEEHQVGPHTFPKHQHPQGERPPFKCSLPSVPITSCSPQDAGCYGDEKGGAWRHPIACSVWLSSILVSVRIPKTLQGPPPSSSVGEDRGPRAVPTNPALSHPCPSCPQTCHRLPNHLGPCTSLGPVLGLSAPSSCAPSTPRVFLVRPCSFLSPPQCSAWLGPDPLSILSNSELRPSFLPLPRLKIPPSQPGTGSHSCPLVNRGGSRTERAGCLLWAHSHLRP